MTVKEFKQLANSDKYVYGEGLDQKDKYLFMYCGFFELFCAAGGLGFFLHLSVDIFLSPKLEKDTTI